MNRETLVMDKIREDELAALAAEGDSAAFERLVSDNYMMIYKVAYKWCGIREDAEDIAQNVCVKLARSLGNYKGASSFKTWLYRIVINTAKDHFRKLSRQREREEAFSKESSTLEAGNPNGESDAARKLHAAIARLPGKLRDAVILVFSEGMSHREAAEVLECAETTVSWRVFQAKKKLKKYLQGEV
jgi:RNA polymerase sigma-70 factor (ECF subfamily)